MLTHYAKLILFMACILLPACATAKPLEHHYTKKPAPQTLEAIVRLHDAKTGEFFCSGVVVSERIILTAGHCLEDRDPKAPEIEVRGSDEVSYGIMVKRAIGEERSDQGLLVGNFESFKTMKASTTAIDNSQVAFSGHKFAACGFPYGGKLFCSSFKMQGYFNFHYVGLALLYPGMSGGPVVDLTTGIVFATNFAADGGQVLINPLLEIYTHLRVPEALRPN